MEHLPENDSGQRDNPAAKHPASTGRMLREAREQHGLTVAEVAGQIKFAPRQIEALEADDYEHLPEIAFLRGFVRSYAKILRLDAEALLANLPQSKAVVAELTPAPVTMLFPNAQSDRQQNLIWLSAAGLLALIVVGFSYWHFKSPPKHAKEPVKEQVKQQSIELPKEQAMELPKAQSTEQSEATQAEVPIEQSTGKKMVDEPLVLKSSTIEPMVHAAPKVRPDGAASSVRETKTQAAKRKSKAASLAAASSVSPSGPMSETAELLLVFGEESWTEIKDKDGKVLSSQVNPPGSELRVQGNPPFAMLIGHAASASLFFQGREVDLKPYINQYSEVAHLTLK
jgi:cytoskeleton protein RodZ